MSSPIVHFEICGEAITDLSEFYGGLFQWDIQDQGPGYALVQTSDSGLRGALRETESTGLSLGVQVEDLAASLERAVAMGAEILMPATDNGWVVKALVADPAGNPITLIQATKPQ